MTAQIGHLFVTLSFGLVFFQLALIAGAPLGSFTQGGRDPGVLPWRSRALAALSIPVLVFCALAVLSAAGFAGGFWPRWTAWAALGVTGCSTALNLLSPSADERRVMGPLAIVMTALAAYVVVVGP
ncbi:hypothetical protein [Allosediminivita pacifica]|uniref:Uncharacterized protein n=1 Tax=Allosediminivita pacifica TaxID=1267769 RepID=A0A2T6B2F1_9RHOB|nr:hypothetical protein [Allosediminivita pacifica]PTX50203.1 hypothetical protein C8N44_10563 [Allosediminivita pacifica]GGB02246.1 hypothetical protein GCM10011324_10590 [Allosediminivita pacifica]